MKRIVSLIVFAASLAAAQSLPSGSATEVSFSKVAPVCDGILSVIFASICRPSVTVKAASADPAVVGFMFVLSYTDYNGSDAIQTQVSTTRLASDSPYFIAGFAGDLAVKAVIAIPLSAGPYAVAYGDRK